MPADAAWGSKPALTIWVYDSPMGAAAGEVRLKGLTRQGAVKVAGAIIVTWVKGTHRPRIGHLRDQQAAAAARSSLLGALVEILTAEDADSDRRLGELAEHLAGTGGARAFLDDARAALAPHTSALLVLSESADLDTVRPVVERGIARGDATLLHASLAPGAVERLGRELGRPLDTADG
jgi:uncharacterized membrane protein